MATRIDRLTIRFEDVNGPRGGVDTICRIKAVMTGAESLLVQQRAKNPEQAVGRVIPRLVRAVRRDADKRGGKTPWPTRARAAAAPTARTRRSGSKRQSPHKRKK
jgi:hypothetical protein